MFSIGTIGYCVKSDVVHHFFISMPDLAQPHLIVIISH
jgi:hypothetical protein